MLRFFMVLRGVLQENIDYPHDLAETGPKPLKNSNSGFGEHGGMRANVSRGTM